MNRFEFLENLKQIYDVIAIKSNRNGASVLRLRHKTVNRDLVLRSYSERVAAYEFIKGINHHNLPIVYDVYNLSDGQVVLEEFIDGLTVADVLENRNYTYNGAKRVIFDISAALITLHSAGIIHRDIKPENIIITNKGEVKLIDFNASREYSPQKQSDTKGLGTLGYASPEQFGISQSDSRADIYALGVLLNVMLTGKHPSEKLAKGKAGKIVLKCTQIDPNSRFQTVEKLVEAL